MCLDGIAREILMRNIEPDPARHSPLRPLLVGDRVDGQQVTGFAWVGLGDEERSTHLDDRLLLDGDENLATPPDRPVPQTAEGAELVAPMPPDDLPASQTPSAASIDVTAPWRADALLNLSGAIWQPVIRPLIEAVHAQGHRIWLAGGAVRDVVSGASIHEVNDLDLAGTVPPGRFSDIAYQTLRAVQMSEFRPRVTPDSLVCSIVPPRAMKAQPRLIEYRGLNLGGFRFPVVGSQLAEDARHRDFSFNTLLYDTLDHVILDPGRDGLADLCGESRIFRPKLVSEDPTARAKVIIRAMKFWLRWSGGPRLDLAPLCEWINTFPADFCDSFSADQWIGLEETYRADVCAPRVRQQEFAAELAGPVRKFVEMLIGGRV